MSYEPGPEGYCADCRRLVPLQSVEGRSRDYQVRVDHRTYRSTEPFTNDPGVCIGSGHPPDTIPRGADIPGQRR